MERASSPGNSLRGSAGAPPIRVLVVDDVPLVRRLISAALSADPEIQVVGTAANGLEAVRLALELRPDVVTMDVAMPLMDGYAAVREIMRRSPVPILVVTGLPLYEQGLVGRMLGLGALEVVVKPEGGTAEYAYLRERVKTLARIRVPTRTPRPRRERPLQTRPSQARPAAIGVVASTGGPAALGRILTGLPADFGIPIVVVQHIACGFVHDLAHWLDQATPLSVRVAAHGDELRPGQVLLAPDERHLELSRHGVVLLDAPPERGIRPSGNRLLRSLAETYRERAVGIVLTGMGFDGAEGLRAVRAAGGLTLVQDRASSVVFGMPRAAIEAHAADEILPLESLALRLRELWAADGARPARGSQ